MNLIKEDLELAFTIATEVLGTRYPGIDSLRMVLRINMTIPLAIEIFKEIRKDNE